jgi:hypothetical protein
MMQSIQMISAFGQFYLTQIMPDEKSGIGRSEICLFIKVFATMADR